MRLLKILLVVILIISPFPIGYFLLEQSFLSSAKPHLFHGDLLKTDIPDTYCPAGNKVFFDIPEGSLKGKKIFYYDTLIGGAGLPVATLLFIHGNRTSSYIYHDVISRLQEKPSPPVRLVALDLIGFGLSDRAPFPISPEEYSETIRSFTTHLNLSDILLVAHEWGAPLGIHALLSTPERVKGILLINSTVFRLTPADTISYSYKLPLFGYSPVSALMPGVLWGKYAAYSIFTPPTLSTLIKIDVVKNLAMGSHPRTGGPKDAEVLFYENHLRSKENIRNARHLLKQAACFNEEADPSCEAFIRFIDDNMNEKWGPGGLNIYVSAIFGDQDMLSDPVMIDKWKTALPQMEDHVRIIRDAGHFLQKENPEAVSEMILEALSAIQMAPAPMEDIVPETPIIELNEETLNEGEGL